LILSVPRRLVKGSFTTTSSENPLGYGRVNLRCPTSGIELLTSDVSVQCCAAELRACIQMLG
jgi:hypothetical protein